MIAGAILFVWGILYLWLPDFLNVLKEIRDELKRLNDREERKGL